MGVSYEDLKTEATNRYDQLFRYTIANVLIVFIVGLIGQNIRSPKSEIVGFLSQFGESINPLVLSALVYLIFSSLITYLIRKEAANDIQFFNTIQQGLDRESEISRATFFQDFVQRFEGMGQLMVWACRISPLAIFGVRFFSILFQLLEQYLVLPSFAHAVIGGFGVGAWVLWLHRIRFSPLTVLIKKKSEIFGS